MGIDPGLRRTGWGIINFDGSKLKHIGNGVCKSNSSLDLASRLLEIYLQLKKIITDYQPEFAAVENTFVNKDPLGALKLGQARGIALLVPAELGIPVSEYAPNTIKKVVVGVGHADKKQVEHMVKLQLPGVLIVNNDSSDALAIALCHAYQSKFKGRLDDALIKAGIEI
jgi:crossover junction endodeoxyribonuclease RuvC